MKCYNISDSWDEFGRLFGTQRVPERSEKSLNSFLVKRYNMSDLWEAFFGIFGPWLSCGGRDARTKSGLSGKDLAVDKIPRYRNSPSSSTLFFFFPWHSGQNCQILLHEIRMKLLCDWFSYRKESRQWVIDPHFFKRGSIALCLFGGFRADFGPRFGGWNQPDTPKRHNENCFINWPIQGFGFGPNLWWIRPNLNLHRIH